MRLGTATVPAGQADGLDVFGVAGPVVVADALGVEAECFVVAGAADPLAVVVEFLHGHEVRGFAFLEDEDHRGLGVQAQGDDGVLVPGALLVVAVVGDVLAQGLVVRSLRRLVVGDDHSAAGDRVGQPVEAGPAPHPGEVVLPEQGLLGPAGAWRQEP